MSIFGVGIDIVNIIRFKRLLNLYDKKFSYFILSNREIKRYLLIINKKENFLSKKFSVTEALSKALGIRINKNFFKNFEIVHNKNGKPKLKLKGYLYQELKNKNIKNIHLSITDTNNYTQSIVILET